jgi:hypothetical protein
LPIIEHNPLNTSVEWGVEGSRFSWVIHGGTTWIIRKNNSIVAVGNVESNDVTLCIHSWQEEDWRVGVYNLSLQLLDGSISTSSSTFIDIHINRGDAFADSVITDLSDWYVLGSFSLGAPDGRFSEIRLDYGNGYMTLDMGYQEEILDEAGDDFTVYSRGGNYTVYITSALNESFHSLSYHSGNQSFDLEGSGYTSVRYVRIVYRSGETVELDAIEAHNVNTPTYDVNAPDITGVDDFWIWSNQTTVTISWIVVDTTPWSYSVSVNDTLMIEGPWNGSRVDYELQAAVPGQVTITLQVSDVFDNIAVDDVVVEIRQVPTSTSNHTQPFDQDVLFTIAIVVGATGVVVTLIVVYRIKMKQ